MEEEKKEEGNKYDQDKERYDLIPAFSLNELAKVYAYGATLYGNRNWEEGIQWGRIFAAIQRHLWKFWGGEANDQESNLPHLAHAAWGCFTLLVYMITHPDLDDRPNTKNNGERTWNTREEYDRWVMAEEANKTTYGKG
jgi:hypothetical protein